MKIFQLPIFPYLFLLKFPQFNSLGSSDGFLYYGTWPMMVQVMSYQLFSIKQFTKSMPTYWQVDLRYKFQSSLN